MVFDFSLAILRKIKEDNGKDIVGKVKVLKFLTWNF